MKGTTTLNFPIIEDEPKYDGQSAWVGLHMEPTSTENPVQCSS